MDRKLTITITVDPEAGEIVIRDGTGNVRTLRSVVVFGGDVEKKAFYVFGHGASADAAWAFMQAFVQAMKFGDPADKSFYKQCASHIVKAIAPKAFQREVDAEELLSRWDKKDPEEGPWQ